MFGDGWYWEWRPFILGIHWLLKRAKPRSLVVRRIEDEWLEGWQVQLLSRASKTTWIKAVLQAIPTYSMSTFLLPKSMCNDLDAKVRRFWWSSKLKGLFLPLRANKVLAFVNLVISMQHLLLNWISSLWAVVKAFGWELNICLTIPFLTTLHKGRFCLCGKVYWV